MGITHEHPEQLEYSVRTRRNICEHLPSTFGYLIPSPDDVGPFPMGRTPQKKKKTSIRWDPMLGHGTWVAMTT